MNLVKDSALVMLVSSSLVGSPNKSYDSKFLYEDILYKDAFKPDFSVFAEKNHSKEIDYSSLIKILEKAYSEIKMPYYIPMSVQMARSYVESGNNPKATSPVGARGLWQMMESSWYDVMNVNFDNAYDPLLNGIASNKHIKKIDIFLRQNYPGFDQLPIGHKRDLLNAAYNGGQGRLKKAGWDINNMPKETRDYVKRMRDRTLFEDMRIYSEYNRYREYSRQNNVVRLDIPQYKR